MTIPNKNVPMMTRRPLSTGDSLPSTTLLQRLRRQIRTNDDIDVMTTKHLWRLRRLRRHRKKKVEWERKSFRTWKSTEETIITTILETLYGVTKQRTLFSDMRCMGKV